MDFRSKTDVRACANIRHEENPVVQSQYSASEIIKSLVDVQFDALDPMPDISLFFHEVFNVDTARGMGLDVWGRIVALPRTLYFIDENIFGFNLSGLQPFNRAPFSNDNALVAQILEDNIYYPMIMAKAWVNISPVDGASINAALKLFFPGLRSYVAETGVMHIRYVIEGTLEPWQRGILRSVDVRLRGAGVMGEIYEIDPAQTFGFKGSGFQPFDQGTFSNSSPAKIVAL